VIFMDVHILAIQARVLLWVGCGWIFIGLWLGTDPTTVAWRAALAAFAAMWLSGKLLRVVAGVINERMVADMADRELANEQAALVGAQVIPATAAVPITSAASARRR
jgi:hypothetical protein